MKQFKTRVVSEIITYETIDLSDEQYDQFIHWYKDVAGEELDENNIDPNYLNDYVIEVGIPILVKKTYTSTDVEFKN